MGRFNTTFITGGVRTIGRRAGTTIIHAEDPSLVLDLQFQRDAAFVPRRGPLPTFTRASAAWCVNSAGLIVPAAVNEPRVDYDPTTLVSLGIKNEPQSTNLFTWSEDLTNAAWVPTNATATANQVTSPDGLVTADLVAETTASGGHYIRSSLPVVTNGVTYTASIFLKKGSGATAPDWIAVAFTAGGFASQVVAFNLSTGAFGASSGTLTYSVKQHPSGWWRVSITTAATATAVGGMFVMFTNNTNVAGAPVYAGQTTSNVFVWGAQLEALDHATSYIPTTSAAAVRSADLFSYTGGAFSGFWNASEGTLMFQGMKAGYITNANYLGVDDGTANNRLILYNPAAGEYVLSTDTGVSQAIVAGGATVANNVAFGLVARYKLNDYAASLSGAAVVVDTSGTVPAVNQMTIGSRLGSAHLSGWIRSVQYYSRTKTDSQLQALSTP